MCGGSMHTVAKFKTRDDIQYIIGNNVRTICKNNNINLMDFSEEIGISYEYLRHIVSIGGQKSLSFYSMY